ncbi:hypothetical protein J6590_062530 [Homalodisca vitripennis]|nr:hypothetical protein J6590_062530 [Homalodisca vitripennis]
MWAVLVLALLSSMAYLPENEARPSRLIYSHGGSYHDPEHHSNSADHDIDASYHNHRSSHGHGHHSHGPNIHDDASYSGFRSSSQNNYGIVSGYGRC